MPGGAPFGNDHAKRGRVWRDAINRALANRSRAKGVEALDAIAEKLLIAADSGDVAALRELGDRIDGKAPQDLNIDANVSAAVAVVPSGSNLEQWVAEFGAGTKSSDA